MVNILWTIAIVIIALCVLGFLIHIATQLIPIALVIVIGIIAYNWYTGKRSI